jgi:hypothetical protein
MKKALILGCSHAAGAEIYKEPGLNLPSSQNLEEYGYTKSYPVKIAQALGYEVRNHAISGGSNDAMFRIFESQKLDQDDIVIACWTGDSRTEIWYEKQQRWLAVTHGNVVLNNVTRNHVMLEGQRLGGMISDADAYADFSKYWITYESDGQRGRLNKLKNILAVNMLAKNQNIKIINIDSFAGIPGTIDVGYWPIGTTKFCEWCLEQKFPHTDWGHFFEPAHQAFADYVLENIDNQL